VENKLHPESGPLPSEATPLDALLEKQHGRSQLDVLPEPASSSLERKPVEGIRLGNLVGLTGDGGFLVHFPNSPDNQPVRALAAVEIQEDRLGREVALAFVDGDIQQPLILGFIQVAASEAASSESKLFEVQQDDKRLVISAENELILKCGESSITLTKAGKVLIRGKYLLSRSSGPNRIKGGSVQIN